MSNINTPYPAQLQDLAASVARYAAPVFIARDHEWRDIGVPDEAQIAAAVMSLLEHVSCDGMSRSGGFAVERYVEGDIERYVVRLALGSCEGSPPVREKRST